MRNRGREKNEEGKNEEGQHPKHQIKILALEKFTLREVGMTQIPAKTPLYNQDFCLWVDATVAKLRAGEFGTVDWEHLIEEVEALAKRDRRELESRLRVLMSCLLKRVYVKSPEDYRGWENTIKDTISKTRSKNSAAKSNCFSKIRPASRVISPSFLKHPGATPLNK